MAELFAFFFSFYETLIVKFNAVFDVVFVLKNSKLTCKIKFVVLTCTCLLLLLIIVRMGSPE